MPPTLAHYLRRRRIITITGTLALGTLLTISLLRSSDLLNQVGSLDRRPVRVTQILDGRTFQVENKTIRLLGVKLDDEQAEACKLKLKVAIADKPVRLAFDIDHLADADGALLAYAYSFDGKLLNEYLITQHVARADGSSHTISDWLARLDRRANAPKRK
jgi:endonuclease YncB( thermonuclease family)